MYSGKDFFREWGSIMGEARIMDRVDWWINVNKVDSKKRRIIHT